VCSPLVIGGTGGSGTRIVTRLVRLGGRYMGSDRNASEDAMPFARFDWEWGVRYLASGESPAMVRAFEDAVAEHLASRPDGGAWGWKHPHSYLLLPFLGERLPEVRFIHVIRDGRDIATSENQQQARHYGPLLGRPDEPEEVRSAAWWAWANLRAREHGESLGGRYLLVRLEDLCADPVAQARRIDEFTGGAAENSAGEVESPGSLGRWRGCDRALIDEIEAACRGALRHFGYPEGS
jgi:hypothetical protein